MKNIVIIVIAAIVFIFATATYTVDQRETAIKFLIAVLPVQYLLLQNI